MQIEELINKLENYINFNLDNPNYGGCAFIMVRVAKELEKRGIYYEISISGANFRINDNRILFYEGFPKVLKFLQKYPIAGSHLFLSNINNKGINFNRDFTEYTDEFTQGIIKRSIIRNIYSFSRKKGLWNPSYSVAQNKKLTKAIKYYFKKFDNERNNVS